MAFDFSSIFRVHYNYVQQVGLDALRSKKRMKMDALERKQVQLAELQSQLTAYRRVIERNERSPVADAER